MTVELSYLERRALRMAAQLALDDDDTREKMYDWQIEGLETAIEALPVEEE
jgi:hypothetical protein